VVNFVARGSIEEGMLSLLSFKKSLFKGVLDGGEKEVFLGGTRLTRFMESVEAATAAIPAGTADEDAEDPAPPQPEAAPAARAARAKKPVEAEQPARPAPAPAAVNPWAGLIEAGLSVLQQLAAPPQGAPGTNGAGGLVHRDEKTGESYLRLPVPPPEVVTQALGAVQKLLESFRR
jgi:hypothetical protein